jgi:hypothetical protein
MNVRNRLVLPDGRTPIVGMKVNITLVLPGRQAQNFTQLTTDNTGHWDIDLPHNTSGYYRVIEGSYNELRFNIPASGTSHWLYNLLI